MSRKVQRTTWQLILATVGLLTACPRLTAQQADTGDLERNLEQQVTVAWQDQQLGAALQRLAEAQEIALWLDRRVDPQQQVTAQFSEVPLRQVLEQLAGAHSLGVTEVGRVVYIGPKQPARELATIVQQAHDSLAKSPTAAKRRWLQVEPSELPRLSEPLALLEKLLDETGIKLLGGEKVPHDLWSARQLPPLPLVERVVLLLAGFDLTCRISPDGRSCEVVPIERPVAVGRRYNLPRNKRKLLSRLQELLSESEFELSGQTLSVEGRWEDHRQVQDLLAGRSVTAHESPRPGKTLQKYSLQLKKQAVGPVIDQLARQLKLEVVWDARAKQSRDTFVSCSAKDVSLDELLQSVLAPAGLQFQREGRRVRIEAAP